MKKLINLKTILLAICLFMGKMVYAGNDNGGGNPSKLRERLSGSWNRKLEDQQELIKAYVKGVSPSGEAGPTLKELFYREMAFVKPKDFADPEVQKVYSHMLAHGLLADIKDSNYVLEDKCLNFKNEEVSMSTRMNVKGADVCINAREVAKTMFIGGEISLRELFGMLIHEHAHHYGYMDENYDIAVALTNSYIVERKKLEDFNPNNLTSYKYGKLPGEIMIRSNGTTLNRSEDDMLFQEESQVWANMKGRITPLDISERCSLNQYFLGFRTTWEPKVSPVVAMHRNEISSSLQPSEGVRFSSNLFFEKKGPALELYCRKRIFPAHIFYALNDEEFRLVKPLLKNIKTMSVSDLRRYLHANFEVDLVPTGAID